MPEKKYRVILEKRMLGGFEQKEVIKQLGRLFKRDEASVIDLLRNAPIVIKKSVDYASAQKYKTALNKIGACCSVEEEAPKDRRERHSKAQGAKKQAKEPIKAEEDNQCENCGYIPGRDGELGITHGECPRCGFVAGKKQSRGHESSISSYANIEDVSIDVFKKEQSYASWGRRILATINTWSLFMSVHMIVLVIVILFLAPREKVGTLLGKEFFKSLFSAYPAFLSILSLFTVMVFIPLLNSGRTLGQRLAGIRLKSLKSGEPDLYMQITMRAIAAVFLTYIPGLITLILVGAMGVYTNIGDKTRLMIICAIISWVMSWLISLFNEQGRGFVDICSSVIQENDHDIGASDVGWVLAPFIFVVFMVILFGLIIPLSI